MILRPTTIHPSPRVIPVSDDIPTQILDALEESFKLLWVSHDACAAQLRFVIEVMMDHERIPREAEGGGFIPLERRIQMWHELYGARSIMKALTAVKWIGNVGIHERGMSRSELLDAYEILDRTLRTIFPRDERHIDSMIDKIIESRGRRPEE